jgi:hypothetical protein
LQKCPSPIIRSFRKPRFSPIARAAMLEDHDLRHVAEHVIEWRCPQLNDSTPSSWTRPRSASIMVMPKATVQRVGEARVHATTQQGRFATDSR